MRRLRFPWPCWSFLIALTLALSPFVTAAGSSGVRADAVGTGVYTNPLGAELYRAYASQDGTHWVRGGVWTHHLGSKARIGLMAMGGSDFTADFDYVRV